MSPVPRSFSSALEKSVWPQPVALFYHTTEPYNPASPDEERLPFDDPRINFDWTTRNR